MPLYLTCPHCDHPMLLAPKWRGRSRLCRQCGWAYLVAAHEDRALSIPARSIAQLRRWIELWRWFNGAQPSGDLALTIGS